MYHATQHNFIENQLSTIKNVYDDNKLKYVCISSSIDESFGRCYIRWNVEIELIDGYHFTYRKSDQYQSYRLWSKDYSSYTIFKECDKNIFKVKRHYFDELFTEYHNDLRRFVELFKSHFPDVKLYNFISEFDFIECGFNGMNVHMSKFDWINYTVLTDNGFIEISLSATEESDIDESHRMVLMERESAVKSHKRYKELMSEES
jgi:hypothetical protein